MAAKYRDYYCKSCQETFVSLDGHCPKCGMQSTRIFTARSPHTCIVCSDPIKMGDKFTWDRTRENTPMHPACLSKYEPSRHSPAKGELPEAQGEGNQEKVYKCVACGKDYAENESAFHITPCDTCDKWKCQCTCKAPAPAPNPPPSDPLIGMLVKYLEPHLKAKVDLAQVDERVNKAIESSAAALRKEFNKSVTVIVKQENLPDVKLDCTHYLFPDLLRHLTDGDNVCMYGPPGSGKTTMAEQAVVEALKLAFSHISLDVQAPRSLLMGFIDAQGRYQRTPYRDRYELGGKFLIDEVFNGSPNLFTSLNTSLANGSCAFPDGVIKRHETFSCIACDNTAGFGGSIHHKDRREADAAFRERFVFMYVPYDETLESRVTLSINPKADKWLRWIREVRQYAETNKIRLIVSPRASFLGAKKLLSGHFTPDQIAESVLWKGLDRDTVSKVTSACPIPRY